MNSLPRYVSNNELELSNNKLAMGVLGGTNSNTSKISFKSKSLTFDQVTKSSDATIAKTLSKSCTQSTVDWTSSGVTYSRNTACSDDSMTSRKSTMLTNYDSSDFNTAMNEGSQLEIGSSVTTQHGYSSAVNHDNLSIDEQSHLVSRNQYNFATPTKSSNHNGQLQIPDPIISSGRGGCTSMKRKKQKLNVEFGLVKETCFELEPGSADSVPANSKYPFCENCFSLQLAEAVGTNSYPCRDQQSPAHKMSSDERYGRYMNAGPDVLLKTIDELQDSNKIVQDERDRFKAKSETFEERSNTAIEALVVQRAGGDLFTHLVDTNSMLSTKNKDLESNLELAGQRVKAFGEENQRLRKQLLSNLPVKLSNVQRAGSHLVKSFKTYDKNNNKRKR